MAPANIVPVGLALLAVAGLSAGIAGHSAGWAFGELTNGDATKGYVPGAKIDLELGWWNSTSVISSGWVPGAFEATGKSARVTGVATVIALSLAALSAAYILLIVILDAFNVHLPKALHSDAYTKSKVTAVFGTLALFLSIGLYLHLLIGSHISIHKKFGDSANIWPRPDWASASAILGSFSLIGLAHHLEPAGYESTGYLPL